MRRWTISVVALLLTVGFASGGDAQAPGGSGEKTMGKDKMAPHGTPGKGVTR